jgi:hypothetical protein
MSVVILFGAGASFGSVDAMPETPPLGINLFRKLEERGGIASSLPETLKNTFGDFEKGMSSYYEYADGNVMAFQRELAHYLAEFTPGMRNVYKELISRLGQNQIIYSTLNYDLLLELSANQLGLPVIYSAKGPVGAVKILKIHGSCNFWPAIPVGMLDGIKISRSFRADIEAPIRPVSQEETIFRCATEKGLAPAIAMYAEGKHVYVCPSFVERQLEEWKESIRDADKIFVVGVRVNEVDEHIWGTLASAKGWLGYIGRTTDQDAFEQWKEHTKRRSASFIESDFKGAVSLMEHILTQDVE